MGLVIQSLIYALLSSCLAAAVSSVCSEETKVFIVRVHHDLKPSHHSNVQAWYSSTLNTLATANDSLHYVYNTVFHGFSAKLTPQQVNQLSQLPEILGVFPQRVLKLQTTRTPAFLGININDTDVGILNHSHSGDNIIIGVIDTGIWPEHPSFNDHGFGPVPSRWRGSCLPGDSENPTTFCNKKIIGARYYGRDSNNITSARDHNGHGTHTASTIAGRRITNASFLGFAQGVASGIAPKARIAVYKVCKSGCNESDILAGIEQAVQDGVDVISMSLGGHPVPYDRDSLAMAMFAATDKGIVFSASAGNNGPYEESVTNVAPWIITVGASTIDREFPADLILGNRRIITGTSLYNGTWPEKTSMVPLIYSPDCFSDYIPDYVHGNIVVCNQLLHDNGFKIKEAGGVGLVNIGGLYETGDGLIAIPYFIPGLVIRQSDGNQLLRYIKATKNPRAAIRFHGTLTGVKPAPILAEFSSHGPNPVSPFVLKPDLIAPGVNILAAWPPSEYTSSFRIESGTSMSCPHVSGIAALLRRAHPHWSPAMIKSAMMTTAYTRDVNERPLLDETYGLEATPWGMGAGHVDPQKALDPGLVYDLTVDDYIDFLCALNYSDKQVRVITHWAVECKKRTEIVRPWDLNYPAISVAFEMMSHSVNISRLVTHVGEEAPSSYVASVRSPKGVKMTVFPLKMVFSKKGEKQRFIVTMSVDDVAHEEVAFGELKWADDKHVVSTPISVRFNYSTKINGSIYGYIKVDNFIVDSPIGLEAADSHRTRAEMIGIYGVRLKGYNQEDAQVHEIKFITLLGG
ncbi:hypothetical protein M0R45_012088 [Rubus argutus]|uniref:Uncharacterized protein n=1 Tax=Rubus argutus TaxID=59490 RepID=A0AAW1YFB7_RUBAR